MNQVDEMAHIIQLSIAPVFLLTGMGTLLSVLSGRLARIIDRARALEQRLESRGGHHPAALRCLSLNVWSQQSLESPFRSDIVVANTRTGELTLF